MLPVESQDTPDKEQNISRRTKRLTRQLMESDLKYKAEILFLDNVNCLHDQLIKKSFLYIEDVNRGVELGILKQLLFGAVCEEANAICSEIHSIHKNSKKHVPNYYVGHWAHNMPMNFTCADTNTPIGILMTTKLIPLLVKYVEQVLLVCNKKTHNKFASLYHPNFAPTVALNILDSSNENRITKLHKDSSDLGVGVLFYFGRYTGGNLTIRSEPTSFEVETNCGDCIILRANKFEHFVQNVKQDGDVRFSVVFFMHRAHIEKEHVAKPQKSALKEYISQHPEYVAMKEEQKKRKQSNNNTKKTKKKKALSSGMNSTAQQ